MPHITTSSTQPIYCYIYLSLLLQTTVGAAATLSVSKFGTGGGTLEAKTREISCGEVCSADFPTDQQLMLEAIPDSKSQFLAWAGSSCSGKTNPCDLTTDSTEKIIAAYFAGAGVATGDGHTVALTPDGKAWAFGNNNNGQLGEGTSTAHLTPFLMPNAPSQPAFENEKIVAVAGGFQHTVLLKEDGTVWAFGDNSKGQLGDGTNTSRNRPETVKIFDATSGRLDDFNGIIAIAAGYQHTVALKGDGTVWAWGSNYAGQLGNGEKTDRPTPVEVKKIEHVIAIAAGKQHSVALKEDGTVWSWGFNTQGQIGDNTTIDRPQPTSAYRLEKVIAIAAGALHTLALRGDGTVWAFGDNSAGQLGDGSSTSRLSPVQVNGLSQAKGLAAGYSHSAAMTKGGVLWTWGKNARGQLGDGTQNNRQRPKVVTTLSGVEIVSVSAGSNYTVGFAKDGKLWTFGQNLYGQLGDGTNTDRLTPVPITIGAVSRYRVTATAGTGGSITPAAQTVNAGARVKFTVTPKANYAIDTVVGCEGTLSGASYLTAPINQDCSIKATFKLEAAYTYTVKAIAGLGGSINPTVRSVSKGKTTTFTVTPNAGYTATVIGCRGKLLGTLYTTGAITSNCTVTATFTAPTYTIRANAGAGGTISPALKTVTANTVAIFSVTANSGYYIGTVVGCSGKLSGNIYTTGKITANCAVAATFIKAPATYLVTVSAESGGTVSPGYAQVTTGKTATFIVTPNTGYYAAVTGCGGKLAGNIYTTGAILKDCAVVVKFSKPSYTVTGVAGTGGIITPNVQTVIAGEKTTLTIAPSDGYNIVSVLGCSGQSFGNTYVTGPITAHCTVTATFTPAIYTVTGVASTGGTISLTAQSASFGAQLTLTVTPNSGYQIGTVTGCNGTLSGNTYKTGAITTNCTVTASFTEIAQYTVSLKTDGTGSGQVTGGGTFTAGKTVTLTATPNKGATLVNWSPEPCASNFIMPAQSLTCTATFIQFVYTVTGTAGLGGTLSPAKQTASFGSSVSFAVMPNSGYQIGTVTGCNGTLSGKTYKTGAITENCTVTASFAEIAKYTVTLKTGGAGSGQVNGGGTFTAGQTVSLSATPNKGSTFTGWSPAPCATSFIMPAQALTCTATFTEEVEWYTVTVSAGIGGTISPTTQSVRSGATVTLTIRADAGYWMSSVTGCGGTLSGNTYTTRPITASCTVNAVFTREEQTYELALTTSGNGSGWVSGDGIFIAGQTVSVSATPEEGSVFAGWSPAPCANSFIMPAKSLTCTAKFVEQVARSEVRVDQSGARNASVGDILFTFLWPVGYYEGYYDGYEYVIENFGSGDALGFAAMAGYDIALFNEDFSDGTIMFTCEADDFSIYVTLTGLTPEQDQRLAFPIDMDTVFGSRTLLLW